MPSAIDKSDIQALVRTGFPTMHQACYHLLTVTDAAAARAWLRSVDGLVNDAVEPAAKPAFKTAQSERALQVAFTFDGLRQLGVPASADEGFSVEFMSGIAGQGNRSRRLGDVGKNDPSNWDWGTPGKMPHVLVALFARSNLDAWQTEAKGTLWNTAFGELTRLDTTHLLNDVEPFGFKDGLSQPSIDWDVQRHAVDELTFTNLIKAGEFLLGYPNEYGKFTERPTVVEDDDPRRILAPAEGQPGRRDLGLNGTYLVFRDLEQDVQGFWQFLDRQASGDREQRERLGSLLVGRTLDGQPLMSISDRSIPGIDRKDEQYNRFTYVSDPAGRRCPLGAHVRRANPRTADFPPRTTGLWDRLNRMLAIGADLTEDDLVSSARFHRLLRRGREYGPELTPDDAAKPGPHDGAKRGLRFLCINANISRQFEFVQQAWMMSTKFAGMTEQSDPLLGNRAEVPDCLATDTFTEPRDAGLARFLSGLGQYTIVRGGGYFFMPSLRALRYIATLTDH